MTWKTHLIGGATAGAGAILLHTYINDMETPIHAAVEFIAISGISALLPDVDEIKSKAGRILLPVSLFFFVAQTVIKIITAFTFGKLKRNIKENTKFMMHRGICHYPITVIIVSLIACITIAMISNNRITWLIRVLAFTIGILSHIMLDIVSGKIALLFPFSKKRIGIKIVESGGTLEAIIVRPVLLIFCVILITRIAR